MQKFQPQVVIQEVQNSGVSDGEDGEQYVITFPQTSFMAVTAYQNQQVNSCCCCVVVAVVVLCFVFDEPSTSRVVNSFMTCRT